MLLMHFTEADCLLLHAILQLSLFTYLFVVCFVNCSFLTMHSAGLFLLITLPVKGQCMQGRDDEGGLVNTDLINILMKKKAPAKDFGSACSWKEAGKGGFIPTDDRHSRFSL